MSLAVEIRPQQWENEDAPVSAGNTGRGLTYPDCRGVEVAVTKRIRYEVLRRDQYRCRYCRSTENPLTIDHVVPVALGGLDDPSNLVAACRNCNAGKTSTTPDAPIVANVSEDALRWSRAISAAGSLLRAEQDTEDAYVMAWAEIWAEKYAPPGHVRSVVALYAAGLPIDQMKDAARIARSARGVDDRFAYFCGIGWKRVARLQDLAQGLIDEGKV